MTTAFSQRNVYKKYNNCIEKMENMRIINICATIAQLAECILGKDEVTGPTPVSGSKKSTFEPLYKGSFFK